MSISKHQIQSWNPSAQPAIGNAWIAVATEIEDLFARYVDSVTKVNDAYWEGLTADAAQGRANADKKTAIAVVDALEALANRAKQGFHEVDAPLQRAKSAVTGAEAEGFEVSDSLQVIDRTTDPDQTRIAAQQSWQQELIDAASAAERADTAVKDALNQGRDGLRATFTNAATLGGEQGKSDGKDLVDKPGELNAEETRRLVEAGRLTPEQLADLHSGGAATIPASHMEYLNEIGRSLDGKSPHEIEQIMDKLPPDAKRGLANSLQIMSTPTVTASVTGDPDVPTKGGENLIPAKMRESMTRGDLVVTDFKTAGTSVAPSIALNGVADNQAIARIAGAADPQYKAGTALDKDLTEVGRKYLDAQVRHDQNSNNKFEYFTVDGRGAENPAVTEEIFKAVGGDKITIEAAVTDKDNGQDFVHNVLTHNWTDNGQAASSMFSFGEHDATVDDPGNKVDIATANRTGNIMQAVAQNMSTSESWEALSNIPEMDNQSVGQVNPDLLRTISHSMSPYVSDLAGADQPKKPGFDIAGWANPAGSQFSGSANVFAALNTDEEAGKAFTQAAMDGIVGNEGQYALAPDAPDSGEHLVTAGRLQGLMDKGVLDGTQAQFDNDHEAAQAAYDRKSAAFDAAKGIATFGKLPTSDYISTMFDAGGDPLKEAIIGAEPDPTAQEAALPAHNFFKDYYNIVAAAPELPPSFADDHPWAFQPDGQLRPWEQLQIVNNPQREAAFQQMFNNLGDPRDGNGTLLRDGYDDVVRKDG